MKVSRLLAAASYFPERIVTNADLEKLVDTNDEWIASRTGIRSRRFAAPGQTCSDLSVEAATRLLKKIGKRADEIDAILVATVTPDMAFPSTACLVQDRLGAKKAWAFDLSAACSGFIYVLSIADQFIRTGKCRNMIVIGAEVMSSILDMKDRSTCVLFGDGAGAVYLEGADPLPSGQGPGIIDTLLYADGSGGKHLFMEAGGSRRPASHETVEKRLHFVRQDGAAVFKIAVAQMANVADEILRKHHFSGEDVRFFVPHQANLRIMDACAKRMNLKPEQMVVNIDRYGNTTAATIPTCLADLDEEGKLKRGDLIVMASFGAGFTWGSALVRWG